MIDQWFLIRVKELIDAHNRIVITDTKGEGAFMLKYLPSRRYIILTASTREEEMKVRIEAERDFRDKKVVFYTTIPKRKLTALQEYASTCGCIVLDDMEAFIKRTLHEKLGINTNIGGRTLLLAAKESKGKDENWWKGIAQGINNPLDPTRLILDFLKDPIAFAEETDEEIYHLMKEEACKLTGIPLTSQTPDVFASELMKALFNKLLVGGAEGELLDIYYNMSDSEEMREQLQAYIDGYDIKLSEVNPYACCPDHPFEAVDKQMFRCLSEKLKNNEDLTDDIRYIEHRLASKRAIRFKPSWLKEVLLLLSFDLGKPHTISSLDQFATYYKDTFAPLDTAMRRIYVEWLNEPLVLRPVQEYYERYNKVMLSSWFELVGGYEQTQQGLVAKMLSEGQNKTAVIVCDGLRLEMAEAIAKRKLPSGLTADRKTAWSKLPSVTPNGMSALYGLPSPADDSINKRHAALAREISEVEIMPLTNLNNSVTANKLVLLYGDIDHIGEAKQMAALVDIANYEENLYKTIIQLFHMGYADIYLTTDHGYVITGILDEADKVPAPDGVHVEDRFLTSANPISEDLFERSDVWLNGIYQYYAKTDKPFVKRGPYGYAHGGLTPQECLIPAYHFSVGNSKVELKVSINNKSDLSAVTGQFFTIKIKGVGDGSNLFETERKVQLFFYLENGMENSKSGIIRIKAGEVCDFEDSLNHDMLKVVVVDAQTTEQLDFCIIKKSLSRDLDDLF